MMEKLKNRRAEQSENNKTQLKDDITKNLTTLTNIKKNAKSKI